MIIISSLCLLTLKKIVLIYFIAGICKTSDHGSLFIIRLNVFLNIPLWIFAFHTMSEICAIYVKYVHTCMFHESCYYTCPHTSIVVFIQDCFMQITMCNKFIMTTYVAECKRTNANCLQECINTVPIFLNIRVKLYVHIYTHKSDFIDKYMFYNV